MELSGTDVKTFTKRFVKIFTKNIPCQEKYDIQSTRIDSTDSIEIEVEDHPYFRRSGDDILLDLDINVAQAVLGDEIRIPTINGDVDLRIPPGTQPGKTFRLRERGIPHLRGSGKGDQLVTVSVQIPTRLTSEQRAMFENLAKTLDPDIKIQEQSFIDKLREVFGG